MMRNLEVYCCNSYMRNRRSSKDGYCSGALLQLVELKNGETYNGHLVNCDTWMNIHLREVICTSKVSFFALFLFQAAYILDRSNWTDIGLKK